MSLMMSHKMLEVSLDQGLLLVLWGIAPAATTAQNLKPRWLSSIHTLLDIRALGYIIDFLQKSKIDQF